MYLQVFDEQANKLASTLAGAGIPFDVFDSQSADLPVVVQARKSTRSGQVITKWLRGRFDAKFGAKFSV